MVSVVGLICAVTDPLRTGGDTVVMTSEGKVFRNEYVLFVVENGVSRVRVRDKKLYEETFE